VRLKKIPNKIHDKNNGQKNFKSCQFIIMRLFYIGNCLLIQNKMKNRIFHKKMNKELEILSYNRQYCEFTFQQPCKYVK